MCVYLVAVQKSVYGVQQSVCLCVLACSVIQVCVCTLQRFHVNAERGRQGAELVVSCRPAGQEVVLQEVDERLCQTAES